MTEERVVDPVTGGEKGRKDEEIGFVDPLALEELAKVAGKGARKYDKYNYLRGYDWSLSYNAMQRHARKMWSGQDIDPEDQLLHIAHTAWHALALVSFQLRKIGNDDRPPRAVGPEPSASRAFTPCSDSNCCSRIVYGP